MFLSLTATATPRVRADIIERLRMRDPVIVAPPHRDNLRPSVQIVADAAKIVQLGRRLRRLQRPGIVYCSSTARRSPPSRGAHERSVLTAHAEPGVAMSR